MNKKLLSEYAYLKFVKEFNNLHKIEKPHWVKEKEIAAAFGDRSENAEYISAKEMLRNIDKRLRFLEKIINTAQVVQTQTLNHTRVNFGSCVKIQNLDTNEVVTYSILGTYEASPSDGVISNISPLGKVLLFKEKDEEFEFKINDESFEYKVLDVSEHIFK
ncbi:MAG: transcription elongation factor GreA [Campylobacterales bacterium]|nr:transcription elongation factor GreA [Campylobacterales bacterium]